MADFFVPRGYVCVLANSRGRGGSEGEWDPYVNEPRDGFDAQQWVGQQPWCNGKVGTFGQSYNAFTQTMSAPLANPHLKCMVPVEGQQSFFGHQYNDGVLQLNVVFTHGLFATGATGLQGHIPIRDPHFLQLPLMSAADKVPHPQAQRIKTWLQHARYDDHWKSFGVKDKYDRIQAPAYFVTGWYDNLVHENFRNFHGFPPAGRQRSGPPRDAAARRPRRSRREPVAAGRIPALVRLLAERPADRDRPGSAAADLRDGRRPLARRIRMAAGPHAVHQVLSAQRRPRQLGARRRAADDDPADRRRVRPTRSSTIRPTRSTRWAGRSRPTPRSGARRIASPSRRGRMCWSTRRSRWPKTRKSPARSS